MAYGTIKVDTITFTDGGVDKSVSVSGLVENPTFTGNVTATDTISGDILRGQTISGVTVTGTTANFTSGNFINISGGTHTITSGVFASGTAANPSISFVLDPNSGLYSPGADQVAISTGGSGKIFIAADGKLGVLTASPTTALDVAGGISGTGALNISGGGWGVLSYVANSFVVDSVPGQTRIFATGTDASTHGNLLFFTGTTNGTAAERLRITSDGRLGLGTSIPGSFSAAANQLVVGSGSGASGVTIFSGSASASNIFFSDSTASPSVGFIQYEHTTDALRLGTNDGTRLYIDSSGRVGIGTTASPVGASIKLTLDGSNGGGIELVSANNGGGALVPSAGGGIQFYTHTGAVGSESYSERARIDSSGRLLVGTSTSASAGDSQYSKLQIRGNTSGNPQLGIISIQRDEAASAITTGEGIGEIVFTDNAGNTFAAVVCEADANAGSGDYPGRLTFSTTADGASSPTERMRIGSNGYVQFSETGTYSPDATSGWHKFYQSADQRCIQTYSTSSTFTNYSLIQYIAAGGGTGSGFASGYSDNGSIQRYIIFSNGNIQNTNNSYAGISDIKLKENIADANSQWLDIKSLQVRNYNLKHSPGHRQIGVIAQEIEQISPGLVYETPDRDEEGNDLGTVTKSVNYSVLYMKAVKALQEAMERIETLEADVAALKTS
jgi:hypothetical protein